MNRNTFFTSDWHLGHENSIQFDERPFRDLDHMHTVLVNNYNSTVGNNDICYFLGDIGLTKGEVIEEVFSRLNNSTKILIRGNHDKKGRQFYYKIGFDLVINMASMPVGKELVTMTHCPLRGVWREDVKGMRGAKEGENWHGESRHKRFSLPDFGQYHLSGHLHSKKGETIVDRQMDVGVPGNDYRPVSLSQIESWIALHKKDIKNK